MFDPNNLDNWDDPNTDYINHISDYTENNDCKSCDGTGYDFDDGGQCNDCAGTGEYIDLVEKDDEED